MNNIQFKGVFAICLAIGIRCLCQADDTGLVAISWKTGPKGEMHISVSNQLAASVHFICGMEQRISGEWREVVLDISKQNSSKSAMVIHLDAQRSVDFKWQRKTYAEFISSSDGVFRVKVSPTDRLGAPKGSPVFSQEMTLKK